MKRVAVLLTLVAVVVLSPSAFACYKCDTVQGCYGTDVGVPGRINCTFDGTCHLMGFCQGFADEPLLAASYTVAAVHVVETETAKAPQPAAKTLPQAQEAAQVATGR